MPRELQRAKAELLKFWILLQCQNAF